MELSRRAFVATGLTAVATLLLAPVRRLWAKKKVAISLDKAAKLKQVWGWTVLKIKDKEYLLVRDSDTTVKVLQAECTHQQCQVAFDPAAKRVQCPCHASAFALDGKVLGAPATVNLPSYPAELKGDKIILELD